MVDPPDIYSTHANALHQPHRQRNHTRCKVSNTNNNGHRRQHRATARHYASHKSIWTVIGTLSLLLVCIVASFNTVSASVLPQHDTRGDKAAHHVSAPSADDQQTSPTAFVNTKSDRDILTHFLNHADYSHATQADTDELIRRLIALRDDNYDDRRAPVPFHRRAKSTAAQASECSKEELSQGQRIAYGIVVPVLVVLSGLFAGLTIAYMMQDETTLQVLSTTGTEKQKRAAQKIIPIRKDGHLLLTTLLIANMITNETLPIVSEPLFPTKILAVVVPTVLIIIFSELVPQSACSRYGLEIGAFMAWPTRVVMFVLWPIAFPVSRVLHWTLGPHHGMVYRRSELKELVTMHAASGGRGGDLKGDTVMMVGGALDLQEKVVKDAMTPIDKVFMLPLDAKLDYPTLERVVRSGHSRIPIYQEIEVPVSMKSGTNTPSKKGLPTLFNALTRRGTSNSVKQPTQGTSDLKAGEQSATEVTTDSLPVPPNSAGLGAQATETIKRKKIVGTLLVKACVLLDPEDAVPVTDMTINALPSVPNDEPLLNVLNAFQEGRSHMAIVTALSRSQSAIDPAAVKGFSAKGATASDKPRTDGLGDIDEERQLETTAAPRNSISAASSTSSSDGDDSPRRLRSFWKKHFGHDDSLHAAHPSDATLTSSAALMEKSEDLSPTARGDILGIITLEDVLEELIGEEIYDEYDPREDGDTAWNNVSPPSSPGATRAIEKLAASNMEKQASDVGTATTLPPPALALSADGEDDGEKADAAQSGVPSKTLLGRLGLSGRKSAPPSRDTSREVRTSSPAAIVEGAATALGGGAAPAVVSMDPHENEGPDYLGALAAGTPSTEPNASDRSSDTKPSESTMRPTAIPGHIVSSSRPGSPGLGSQQAALASPQPSRPVVLRKQRPDGTAQNVIVGEHLLRGRRIAPGTPVISVPNNSAGEGLTLAGPVAALQGGANSRSSTPRASRFKSTPVQQTDGGGGGGTTGGSNARERSMSTEPAPQRQNTNLSLDERSVDAPN